MPALVRADARKWWTIVRNVEYGQNLRGAVAAWAADQCLLGRRGHMKRQLRRMVRRRRFEPTSDFDHGKFNRAYERDLLRFLKRTGYCR